ncbi:PseG/SpsG family protein [Shewanella sp. BJSY2023SW005]|uniref:PseG/SpsG family protein n=1 Tax=Shewanella sp. BJSY2023SW005 TaxID=3392043 RepID=UPI0039B4D47F
MQAKPQIAFYGNNSDKIGAGHIMRLYALAQAAEDRFEINFLYKTCSETLLNKLKQANFNSIQVSNTLTANEIKHHDFKAIIIDDYELTPCEWHQLSELNTYLVKLDDALDDSPIIADLIVNPAPNCTSADYRLRAPQANYCLGPQFTYLRKEFALPQFIPVLQRPQLLLTLGGTDVKSLALPLSQALLRVLPQCQIKLLLGTTHQDQASLQRLSGQYGNFTLVCDPPSVAEVMMQTGLAVSAAGGTLGELASQGVPTLSLVTVDNQVPAMISPLNNTWYQTLDCRHYAPAEGDTQSNQDIINTIALKAKSIWHNKCLREQMSDQARQLIDSHGCQRIIKRLVIGLKEKSEHQ